jgi:hypothetical protein
LIVVLAVQPLLAFASIALPVTHTVTTFDSCEDDDDALDLVLGGDPVVMTGAIALPVLEPRAGVADPAPTQIPPRVADPADHPPRPA